MSPDKKSLPFYHSAAWRKVRAQRLMLDGGMCAKCMEEIAGGAKIKPRRATLVHHVIPVSERPDLALDVENLQSLCDMHHNQEHPEKGGRGAAGKKKAHKPARMRIIKIGG